MSLLKEKSDRKGVREFTEEFFNRTSKRIRIRTSTKVMEKKRLPMRDKVFSGEGLEMRGGTTEGIGIVSRDLEILPQSQRI